MIHTHTHCFTYTYAPHKPPSPLVYTQDLSSMIDAAKYCDLVLLLIDGSFGFEMETFEFLNLLQVHGFPKVMGVLTHLDGFRDNKSLKTTKKNLKHRFWAEIYQGVGVGGWVYGWACVGRCRLSLFVHDLTRTNHLENIRTWLFHLNMFPNHPLFSPKPILTHPHSPYTTFRRQALLPQWH